jgi:hypothetical protein
MTKVNKSVAAQSEFHIYPIKQDAVPLYLTFFIYGSERIRLKI